MADAEGSAVIRSIARKLSLFGFSRRLLNHCVLSDQYGTTNDMHSVSSTKNSSACKLLKFPWTGSSMVEQLTLNRSLTHCCAVFSMHCLCFG